MTVLPLNRGYETTVDSDDLGLVNKHHWFIDVRPRNVYVITNVKRPDGTKKRIYLHRFLMGFPDGQVDHINHDGLDNRRANLRLATVSQNGGNQRTRTGRLYKGVSYNPRGYWSADVCCRGKKENLGKYETPEAAAFAYNARARELFGPFAHVNDERILQGALKKLRVQLSTSPSVLLWLQDLPGFQVEELTGELVEARD